MPFDNAAEVAVLGSMIIAPDVIEAVAATLLSPDAFFFDKHQILYSVIVDLFRKQSQLDPLIIRSELERRGKLDEVGGLDYLTEILNSVPTPDHAEFYAQNVLRQHQRRQVIATGMRILKQAYDPNEDTTEIVDRAQKAIHSITTGDKTGTTVTLQQAMNKVFDYMDSHKDGEMSGIPTGIEKLDELTSGLQNGQMILIAARPSVGKTSLVFEIAEYAAIDFGNPTLLVSLEMSELEVGQRIMCSRADVNLHAMRRNCLNMIERNALTKTVHEIIKAPLYIETTSGLTVAQLRTIARNMVKSKGIKLIVVDYLQLMAGEASKVSNRQEQISAISRGIKSLAMELNIPIVALSQLNRGSESEQRMPRMSDLRESGSLEQDADVVILLHRDAVAHRGEIGWAEDHPEEAHRATLILAKQRMGPCDSFHLTFQDHNAKFVNHTNG